LINVFQSVDHYNDFKLKLYSKNFDIELNINDKNTKLPA